MAPPPERASDELLVQATALPLIVPVPSDETSRQNLNVEIAPPLPSAALPEMVEPFVSRSAITSESEAEEPDPWMYLMAPPSPTSPLPSYAQLASI